MHNASYASMYDLQQEITFSEVMKNNDYQKKKKSTTRDGVKDDSLRGSDNTTSVAMASYGSICTINKIPHLKKKNLRSTELCTSTSRVCVLSRYRSRGM